MNLAQFPRRRYTIGQTPIEKLPRFSEALGGPNIYIKRDDLLGLAAGGNKTRKLEFLVVDALSQNADTLITWGAVQSNHCRLTLAAAVKEGLKCRLVLEVRVPGSYTAEATGNKHPDLWDVKPRPPPKANDLPINIQIDYSARPPRPETGAGSGGATHLILLAKPYVYSKPDFLRLQRRRSVWARDPQVPSCEVSPPLEGLSLLRSGLVRLRRIIPLRLMPRLKPGL